MGNFISINDSLPGLNKCCDIKLHGGSIKQARLIKDSKKHTIFWVDNNYKFSAYATHWKYNENVGEQETKEWFSKWSNKDVK